MLSLLEILEVSYRSIVVICCFLCTMPMFYHGRPLPLNEDMGGLTQSLVSPALEVFNRVPQGCLWKCCPLPALDLQGFFGSCALVSFNSESTVVQKFHILLFARDSFYCK